MAGKRGTRIEVAAKWRKRLGRWQRAQCSVTEFCRRERVSQQSFFLWRKRLAAEEAPARVSVGVRGAAFLPVEVVPDDEPNLLHSMSLTAPAAGAWLEFSRGALVCRVPMEVDEPTLRRVVRVLSEEAPRC